VAPNVKLMVLKVSDCTSGAIYAAAVFRALDYALRMGAHIVSCSFGRVYPQQFKPPGYAPPWEDHQEQAAAYTRALTPLRAARVLVLAAAGNNAVDLDALADLGYSNSPCLVGRVLDNVLCVSATAANDSLAAYSNYGRQAVVLAAPGSVRSTWPGGGVRELWGTSMATPVVTGTAALVLSVLSDLSSNATTRAGVVVKQLLLGSADLVAAVAPNSAVVGARRVNATAAVQAALSRNTPAGLPAVLPLPASASANAALSLASLVERYYAAAVTGGWQKGLPVSTTARAAQLPLGGFKLGSGYVARFTAAISLSTVGIYSIRITNAASAQLAISDALPASRPFPAGSRTFTFLVKAPGWFSVDIALPKPAGSVDVLLRTPESGAFARMTSWRTFVAAPPALVPRTPSFVTARSEWTVYFNASSQVPAAASLTSLGDPMQRSGLPAFRQVAVAAPALGFAPGALRSFLFPSSATAGAVGSVIGGVEVSSANAGYLFRVCGFLWDVAVGCACRVDQTCLLVDLALLLETN